jgi:hypothetical protein
MNLKMDIGRSAESQPQQKVQVSKRVWTPWKYLGISINVACANSDCTKNDVEADNASERDCPEESVDLAAWNKIVEVAHVAEITMRSGEMQTRSSGKDHHGCGEQLSGCEQENSGELISLGDLRGNDRSSLAGKVLERT